MFIDDRLFDQTIFADAEIGLDGFILMGGRHVEVVAHHDAVADDGSMADVGSEADDAVGYFLGFDDAPFADDRLDDFGALDFGSGKISGRV